MDNETEKRGLELEWDKDVQEAIRCLVLIANGGDWRQWEQHRTDTRGIVTDRAANAIQRRINALIRATQPNPIEMQKTLLTVASVLLSYSEDSAIANHNRLFYDLMLREGRRCAEAAGVFRWEDRQILFGKIIEALGALPDKTV